jgi:hypothetical protein
MSILFHRDHLIIIMPCVPKGKTQCWLLNRGGIVIIRARLEQFVTPDVETQQWAKRRGRCAASLAL